MFYPVATTTLSIVSGLVGYKFAVSSDPAGAKGYVLAIAFGLLVQVPLVALISNRRDKLVKLENVLRFVSIRIRLGVGLSWMMSLLMGLLYVSFGKIIFGYLSLIFVGTAVQYASYRESSGQLVRDIKTFWKIQFLGAWVRAIGVGLLVIIYRFDYPGILIANIAAALVICIQYGCNPFDHLSRIDQIIRAVKLGWKKLITIDGIMRSAKASYEASIISFGALAVEKFAGTPIHSIEAMYGAVGYVNTLAVGLRQVLSSWELDLMKPPSIRWLMAIFIFGSMLAVLLQQYFGFFNVFLPRMARDSLVKIIEACGIFVVIFPLTRGFLYLDYRSPVKVKQFAKAVLFSLLISVVIVVIAIRMGGDLVSPLWAAVAPLSIALGLRFSRA